MARGRMLNKTIATDKRLNKLSPNADWMYIRTIPHLDRDGIIDGDPDTLAVTICPWRLAMIADEMPSIIDEWVKSGLAVKYESGDKTALYFVGFQKNQSLEYRKEAASSFIAPPGTKRTDRGLVESTSDDQSTSSSTPNDKQGWSRRGVVEESSSTRHEYKLNRIELNVSEGKDTRVCATVEHESPTPHPTPSGSSTEFAKAIAESITEPKRQPEPVTESLTVEPELETQAIADPVVEPAPKPESVAEPELPKVTRITYAQILDARVKAAKEAMPVEIFDPPARGRTATPTEPTPDAAHVIPLATGEKLFIPDSAWTGMIGAVLDGLGTKALVDTGSITGKNKRAEATFTLETLCKMSEKFRTVDGINALFKSWRKARPDEGAPLPAYLEEHASKYLSGKVRYPGQSAPKKQGVLANVDPNFTIQQYTGVPDYSDPCWDNIQF